MTFPDYFWLVTTYYLLMLANAYCSQLTAHCALLTAHSSLLTAHCSLLTAHCSLLTAHCSLLTAHCLPPTTLFLVYHTSPPQHMLALLLAHHIACGPCNKKQSTIEQVQSKTHLLKKTETRKQRLRENSRNALFCNTENDENARARRGGGGGSKHTCKKACAWSPCMRFFSFFLSFFCFQYMRFLLHVFLATHALHRTQPLHTLHLGWTDGHSLLAFTTILISFVHPPQVEFWSGECIVTGVMEGGPAEGKLVVGDIVLMIDGEECKSVLDLQKVHVIRYPTDPVLLRPVSSYATPPLLILPHFMYLRHICPPSPTQSHPHPSNPTQSHPAR